MAGLSILKIKSLKSGRHGDGRGLYLQVRGDNRSWLFRFKMNGRARAMGLGPYPEITLAEARDAALEARRLVLKGIDPIEAKTAAAVATKIEKAPGRTFKDVATRYIEDQRDGWKSSKHATQWVTSLEAHVYPKLGSMAVSKISTDDVLGVLRPIWSETPETASRIRGRLEAILDAAVAMKLRPAGVNPASWKGNLKSLLPPAARMKKAAGQASFPALPWRQAPAFLEALHRDGGMAVRALKFAILTAARSGEVRGMTWGEVDLGAATWVIPQERMKATKLHRIPLSSEAVAILRSLPRISADPAALVFPGQTERAGKQNPLSDMSLSIIVKRMNAKAGGPFWVDETGKPIVPHGFRSTFRDWVSEATDYPGDIAEAQLAHALRSKVEASYSRSDHLEKRREMMSLWSAFLSGSRQP